MPRFHSAARRSDSLTGSAAALPATRAPQEPRAQLRAQVRLRRRPHEPVGDLGPDLVGRRRRRRDVRDGRALRVALDDLPRVVGQVVERAAGRRPRGPRSAAAACGRCAGRRRSRRTRACRSPRRAPPRGARRRRRRSRRAISTARGSSSSAGVRRRGVDHRRGSVGVRRLQRDREFPRPPRRPRR